MEAMADNFLVRTDCEVRMHCNNSKLSRVPEWKCVPAPATGPVKPVKTPFGVRGAEEKVAPPALREPRVTPPPSVDAFYGAYRLPRRLMNSGARVRRTSPAVGLELTAVT
jgi:hypothetical protein